MGRKGCECQGLSENNCNTYKLEVGVKINANLTKARALILQRVVGISRKIMVNIPTFRWALKIKPWKINKRVLTVWWSFSGQNVEEGQCCDEESLVELQQAVAVLCAWMKSLLPIHQPLTRALTSFLSLSSVLNISHADSLRSQTPMHPSYLRRAVPSCRTAPSTMRP